MGRKRYLLVFFVFLVVLVIPKQEIISKNLSTSTQIVVNSDEDFKNYSFEGTGTKNNPYKIENRIITVQNETGIFIAYTTKYFVIRNCKITGLGDYGIRVALIEPGTAEIKENYVETCITGISILANETLIENNRLISCSKSISVHLSGNSIVRSNTLQRSSKYGIELLYADDIEIKNNTIKEIYSHTAVKLTQSKRCEISFNNLNDLYDVGVLLGIGTEDNIVHHNNFKGTYTSSGGQDDGKYNTWYDEKKKEGNYWYDYSGHGDYEISGSTGALDIYPLKNQVIYTEEVSWNYTVLLFSTIAIGAFLLKKRREKVN
ncbi:MAG: NosD domain-containing protein [Candidatus Heimdallarchaeaceae archaeon]